MGLDESNPDSHTSRQSTALMLIVIMLLVGSAILLDYEWREGDASLFRSCAGETSATTV